MIRQLLTGCAGGGLMALGALCALMADPPWAGFAAGGVLVVIGAGAMSWAVGDA